MAKSKAKKLREKFEREGKRNPELNRSQFAFADLRTRRDKSKKDVLYQSKNKNQFSKEDGKDGSFYFSKTIHSFSYIGMLKGTQMIFGSLLIKYYLQESSRLHLIIPFQS